jgi:HEAT repeat protein
MSNSDDGKDLRVSNEAFVLFRIEDNEVERICAYSEHCRLDAGGVPFYWLTDVDPKESIDLLTSYAADDRRSRRSRERVTERALSAIAVHDDPAMLDALESFVDSDQPEWLREKSVFWIGNSGERRGIDILRRVLRDDPSSDVREQCVFALTLPDDPEATDLLISIARTDRDRDVRKNAIFWLSQEAGERAVEAIVDAIKDDPDTDIKEQAVFALSQLPKDEGVPHLIRVARTNRNPDVREQAIFWLGQSGDDRALDFFEEILSK